MKDRALHALLRFSAAFVRILPRPVAGALGAAACHLASCFLPRRLRAVRENLANVLGAPPSAAAARRTFRAFGRYLADLPRFTADSLPAAARDYRIATPDTLRALAAEPDGALLVTAHLGNWELAGAVVAALGRPLHAVERPVASPALECFLDELRECRGLRLIPLADTPRAILRALRQRHFVAMLADRDFGGASAPVPFFGRPARLPRGPAWFAWRTRVPVYVGFAVLAPDHRWEFRLLPPLRPENHPGEDALRLAIAGALQDAISRAPFQWYAFEPFWPPA